MEDIPEARLCLTFPALCGIHRAERVLRFAVICDIRQERGFCKKSPIGISVHSVCPGTFIEISIEPGTAIT